MDRKKRRESLAPLASVAGPPRQAGAAPKTSVRKPSDPPNYMRATSSTTNRRTTPSGGKTLTRAESKGSIKKTSSSSSSSLKKTSTPIRAGARGLNFSNASSIEGQSAAAADFAVVKANNPFGAAPLPVKLCKPQRPLPLRPAHLVEGNNHSSSRGEDRLSDEIEFELQRQQLICSWRLREKAAEAVTDVQKKGLRVCSGFHQLINCTQNSIKSIRAQERLFKAVLPHARQLKVLSERLEQLLALKTDVESNISFLRDRTRDKLSVLPFKSHDMPLKEVQTTLTEAERALRAPALDRLPMLVQVLTSFLALRQKLRHITDQVVKCQQLLKEIHEVEEKSIRLRTFMQKHACPAE